MNQIAKVVREIAAFVKELWSGFEESGYCCGVHLDRRNCCAEAPKWSSCCSVRE